MGSRFPPSTNQKRSQRNLLRALFTHADLRKRLFATLALVILFRFLLNVPLPGITITSNEAYENLGSGNNLYLLVEFIGMLSGGSLLTLSVLALGLFPYNASSALLTLLMPLLPSFQREVKENPWTASRIFTRWNLFLAIPIAILESFFLFFLISPNCQGKFFILENSGTQSSIILTVTTISILVAGSFFAVWISELISHYGIKGQGNAILVTSNIIAGFSSEIIKLVNSQLHVGPISFYFVLLLGSILIVIYLLLGRRNIPVVYFEKKTRVCWAKKRSEISDTISTS
ncbi:MAG: hypothetical protein IPM31_12400 [Anaerolineae bacterium]|nr:hypothetical protein [Anaerolineae bacterium]MBL8107610.1 hypothetical protein [Anaerolineales bacterium]MCC7189379.1 hypothetical protein [Anaerolineales bacterium]